MPDSVSMFQSPQLAVSPKWKYTTNILLNGHVVKLPSKYLYLYTQIDATLCFGQRSLDLQVKIVNVVTDNYLK